MNLLITGGAGFVGGSLAIFLKQKHPAYKITCFDNLKRRGSELNLNRLKHHGIEFIHGDIRNKEDFDQLGETHSIIDASAEPSVLAGINGSTDYVVNTNLMGTINCLNFAARSKSNFLFLSTSRIYPIDSLNKIAYKEEKTRFTIESAQVLAGVTTRGIAENFPKEGARSFYGASKYASELFIQEYQEFFQLKTVINRFGVIAGPWQMGKIDQGVMVLWVAKHFWKQSLSYFGFNGTGKQVRDILHIDDLCELIDHQLHNMSMVAGGTFNAGGGLNVSASLCELTELCKKITGNTIPITPVREGRQADIPIYITDNTHIEKAIGWTPKRATEQIVTDIYKWIKENERILSPILK